MIDMKMKKNLYFVVSLFVGCLLGTASCIDDESTYGDNSVLLELSGLEDSYEVVSFSSDLLQINPVVKSSFAESDLEYAWSYYSNASVSNSASTDTIKADTISREKNLSYNPAVTDGSYTLVFTAKSKSTGYRQSISTTFNASSALSRGFYVMKETADGNTDLDLYNTRLQELIPDVLTKYQGAAMRGKPRCLDVIHQQAYINEEGRLHHHLLPRECALRSRVGRNTLPHSTRLLGGVLPDQQWRLFSLLWRIRRKRCAGSLRWNWRQRACC